MAIDGQALDYRYTLYFDFLGTSSATTTWSIQKVHELIDLLTMVAQARSVEKIDGSALEDGGYSISITPEISTFSDHVVASYPSNYQEDISGRDLIMCELWTELVCKDCIRIVSAVAERALRLGVLLRGAITFGELYHSENVVFGEALVQAEKLEREVASNPRVLVSPTIVKMLNGGAEAHLDILQADSDTLHHLNYLPALRQHGSSDQEAQLRWEAAMRSIITENLKNLESLPAQKEKWSWLSERFEAAYKR